MRAIYTDGMPSLYLQQLSWPEAATALPNADCVVIPLGAQLKEHGHHLPLNTDWLLAEYLSQRLQVTENLLITPTIGSSYFPAFVDYPGTVSLGKACASQLLEETIACLARHGARRFYILNTGVSTNWVLEPLRLKLQQQRVPLCYSDLLKVLPDIEVQVAQQRCGSHADEIETSMMLYIAPDRVRMELASCEYGERPGKPPVQSGPFRRHPGQPGFYSPSGVFGDATLASAAKGRWVLKQLSRQISQQISGFSQPDWQPEPAEERYLS